MTLQRSILSLGFLLESVKQQCQIQRHSGRVTVIGVEIEIDESSSNSGWVAFAFALMPLTKVMNQSLPFPDMG